MLLETGVQLLWLFFVYSFLGWLLETIAASAKHKKYVNRGVLTGPFCISYGTAAVIITINLSELKGGWIFLFLGSMIYATVIEWIGGKLLEKANYGRWWDYSNIKWNLDGYICLPYSILWGVLGLAAVKWGNPFFDQILLMLPEFLQIFLLGGLFGIGIVDFMGSGFVLLHIIRRFPRVEQANHKIAKWTIGFGNWIAQRVEKRIEKSTPKLEKRAVEDTTKTPAVFAQGCGFYKLCALFFIGAFLGDMVETVFCRVTVGAWMSRSSVVIGPFSIVWGLALAMATALLYKYRKRPDSFLFLFGTVLGGAYEYLCSVFTEVFFGTVFWDYSGFAFNLGGRINLLYCFFWGIATVVWIKILYPKLSCLIEKIPMKAGKAVTICMVLFMTANVAASGLALARYNQRGEGRMPSSKWEKFMDQHFPDEKMEKIYPNAKKA